MLEHVRRLPHERSGHHDSARLESVFPLVSLQALDRHTRRDCPDDAAADAGLEGDDCLEGDGGQARRPPSPGEVFGRVGILRIENGVSRDCVFTV